MCIILGYLAGKTSIRRAIAWCARHLDELRVYMPLENGVASVSTAWRILAGVDAELFRLEFMAWAGEIIDPDGKHIAVDGKAFCASASKVSDNGSPMALNAIEVGTGLVIGHFPLSGKGNEITALPKLLEQLSLRGSTVTIDAIGTQTAIMGMILDLGAHFTLFVKKNQPTAYEDIITFFEVMSEDRRKMAENPHHRPEYPEQMGAYDEWSAVEKNRERMEYRTAGACSDCSHLGKKTEEWTYVSTIGFSKQVRIKISRDADGNDTTPSLEEFLKGNPEESDEKDAPVQLIGMVSDRELKAREMAVFRRNHWAVENRLHHVLDDTFREDRSPAKKTVHSLAIVRKIAYNVIRLVMLEEGVVRTVPEMMDIFADEVDRAAKVVFEPVAGMIE